MRPTKDDTFMEIAHAMSKRATCPRRQVGTVLVNSFYHIVGTGFNGNPRNMPHCIDKPCSGAYLSSGEGLEACEALHAEQNALLQCKDVDDIEVCYCTSAPCIHCTKMLMNTSCNRIVAIGDYIHSGKKYWLASGREWSTL